jgi:hypothetical protein
VVIKFLVTSLKKIQKESGSISIFISGLFLIVFMLSIGIIGVSDSFVAKRELVQIGEDAILVASHSIDESRYYAESPLLGQITANRVPIDCAKASVTFATEVSSRSLRGNPISISGWRCSSDQITVSISSNILPIVSFPVLSNVSGSQISINAIVGATSEVAGN